MKKHLAPLWKILEPGPKDKFPDVIYVIVEVPKGSQEKYELDKETGTLFLNRDLFGSMVFPGDYGSIPKTLCKEDKDPVDALILVSRPHHPGIVIPARPIALMKMEDEKGRDDKILCVPDDKVDPSFKEIRDLKDIPNHLVFKIKNFFEHYKDLEPRKWVRVGKWEDKEKAKKYILEAVNLYKQEFEKSNKNNEKNFSH